MSVPPSATVKTVLSCEKRGVERRGDDTRTEIDGDVRVAITYTGTHILPQGNSVGAAEAMSVSHASIEDVDVGGIVRRRIELVAEDATYELRVDRRSDLEEIATFLERAASVWQAVLQDLQTVRRAVAIMGQELDADNLSGLDERYAAASDSLASARDRAANTVAQVGIEAAADRLERALLRQRARWLYKSGQRSMQIASERQETADIAAARRGYERAREQFRTALSIIEDEGFGGDERIRNRLHALEDANADLDSDPLAAALKACRRGAEAEDTFTAWESWNDARERYRAELDSRDSLIAIERLRFQLAWVEANFVQAAREYAAELETEGREYIVDGEANWGRELFMGAIDVLNVAIPVARDRNGIDPTPIREYRDQLKRKCDEIDGWVDN